MSLIQDLRFAARMLRRSPGFSLLAIAVLAIGIGANTAVFTLVDGVLLKPLPFPNPQQLAMLYEKAPKYDKNTVSPLNFHDWQQQNGSFQAMAALSGAMAAYSTPSGVAERLPAQGVTAGFFEVFGIQPLAGRFFQSADDRQGTDVAVISERMWRTRFGASADTVGSAIRLDGKPVTIIGVAPAGFQVLYEADLWRPYRVKVSPEQRRMHYLRVFARLKPGVTLDQARGDMARVADGIAAASPETNKGWGVTITPLREAFVGAELRVTSLVLGALVGLVLLIACANVANLLLARGSARAREIAVRASLGGSGRRIARQLLTESLLLAALGAAAGIALAWTLIRLAPAAIPPGTLPVSVALALDWRTIAFAVAAAAATGILFGLAPAWQATRTSLADALRAGGRGASSGGGAFRVALAALEVAMAVMLVAGAGLLLRTLSSLTAVDPGFRADRVLTMRITTWGRYRDPADSLRVYQAARREIGALPGVKSVAFATSLPLNGWNIGQAFEIAGDPPAPQGRKSSAHYQIASGNYFEAMGIPLVKGRTYRDGEPSPVCVVSEGFVRKYLRGRDPLASRVRVDSMDMAGPKPVEREIVGVVRQVKVDSPSETEALPEIYVPITQNPWFDTTIVIAANVEPLSLLASVKKAIARVDKDQPVTDAASMDEVAALAVATPRFRAQLVTAFAAIALALAAAGIFGVMALTVSQRSREFGVRMALGAARADVLGMVMAQGIRIAAAGTALGLAATAALSRLMASLLFGVTPFDPLTFAGAPLVLAAAALAACALPAWRATRVDPAVALRDE